MRHLYTILLYIAIPFILLRLLWKSRKNPAYRQRIKERFGYLNKPLSTGGIWVHAVSVGEVLAAVPLIKQLQQRHPNLPIIITTMTPTGADRVKAAFGETIPHVYVPYDLPSCNQRFLQNVKPRLIMMVETELWPNLLNQAAQQKIPTVVLNARLSARSANGYRRLGKLTRDMLKQVTLIAAQNKGDGERFVALGLPPEHLRVTGSIKYDLELPANLMVKAQALQSQWAKRPVWIAASTHESEEEIVLAAYHKILQKLPQILLILVPRHPERFNKVASLCQKHRYSIVKRSEDLPITVQTQIFLGDSMGELLLFYACANVAFVGGSLVATGGHNPLEPAALGLPVLTGPHMFNFAVIQKQLLDAGAAITIQDATQLAETVIQLLQDKTKCQTMGAKGEQILRQNRGALARQLELIETFL